jgi:hypothetical protein
MKYLSLLSLAILFVLSSCNKYSEGPNFSLLTKKARVVNDWLLDGYTKDGTELYDQGYEDNLSIEKDGTYSRTTITPTLGQLQSVSSHGTWEFDNSKTSISFLEEGSIIGVSYEIIMLKNKSLKLRQTDFNNANFDWTFYAN